MEQLSIYTNPVWSTSCLFLTVVGGSTDFIIGALKGVQWLFHSLRVHWHSTSELLSTRIKLTLNRARIRSIKTYATATWVFATYTWLPELSACEWRLASPLVYLQDVHQSAIWMSLPKFQNYAGCKQKSYKLMKMLAFTVMDTAKLMCSRDIARRDT